MYITNSSVHPLKCKWLPHFSPISPSALAELLELQEKGHISSSVAKQVSQLHRPCNYPLLSVTQYKDPSYCLFAFLFSPASSWFLPALRCSRRCGGHQARRPHRSSRSRTWVLLVTPHSCTASARRWWTRIPMRWRLTCKFSLAIPLFICFVVFVCLRCFVFAVPLCRFTPLEMETRKFWTSWWGWFRKRPKADLTQFWWGKFYKRRLHEGRDCSVSVPQTESQVMANVTFMKDKRYDKYDDVDL